MSFPRCVPNSILTLIVLTMNTDIYFDASSFRESSTLVNNWILFVIICLMDFTTCSQSCWRFSNSGSISQKQEDLIVIYEAPILFKLNRFQYHILSFNDEKISNQIWFTTFWNLDFVEDYNISSIANIIYIVGSD